MTREITIQDKFHCRKGLYVDGDAIITGDLSVNGSAVGLGGGGGGGSGSGIDTGLRALSANWDVAYTAVTTNSGQWATQTNVTNLTTSAVDWNSTFTSVSDNSANWSDTFTAVSANSGYWDSAFTTVSANSATWTDRIDNGTVGLTAHDPAIGSDYLHFTGHILPSAHEQYDIGAADKKIRHLFLSDNSLTIGDTKAQEAFFTSLSGLSALAGQEKQVVTTPTTTTPGASAVNQILAVTELPAIQQEGVLYIVIE